VISCAEAVRQLWEYLDGVAGQARSAAIEEHLGLCRRCCGEAEFAAELRSFLAATPTTTSPRRCMRGCSPRSPRWRTSHEPAAAPRPAAHPGDQGAGPRHLSRGGQPRRSGGAQAHSAEELAQVPQIAIDGALGVASPLRHAGVEPGETVLDLGCGYGIDTLLAARRTGPAGRVIALDFLPAMLDRTAEAAAQAGLQNVDTLHADIEDIPLPDRSIDLIISNGVLNLCPRKARAFAECRRVLRPGGKLCVADMSVEEDDLPAEVLTHQAAWIGCTAGALTEHDFARKLGKAGFGEIEIVERRPQSIDDLAVYPLFPAELLQLMRNCIPPGKHARIATAIVVTAVARSQIESRPQHSWGGDRPLRVPGERRA
jgi:arsenite methyltransferase